MRLDRRRWFKDSAAQLAHRQALGERNPEPAPIPTADAQIAFELNKIAEFRKSNLKGYFRDEQMQARERLLLAKRAGG
jgi:hypothetical protein